MYDFIDFSQGTNFYMNLYCFLLYCFLLLTSLRGNVVGLCTRESYRGRTWILAAGLLLFALTSFVGADFFHYYENMVEYKNQAFGDQERGLEAFYQYLIYYTNGNYFLFRLVVWGSSLALIILAARKFGASAYSTLFIILAGFIVIYSYARATLAMSVCTLGIVLICVAHERSKGFLLLLKVLGALILLSSVHLHRSMAPVILIMLVCSVLPLKKGWTKQSLYWFPVLVAIIAVLLRFSIAELLSLANSYDDESGTLEKLDLYSTANNNSESNLNGYVSLIFGYATFYVPFFLIARTYSKADNLNMITPKGLMLYRCVYFIFVFATSLLFIGANSNIMFYRYLYMAFIPLSILIAHSRSIGVLNDRCFKWIVVCLITSTLLQLFGAVYGQM